MKDFLLSFASQVGTSLVNNALSQHNAREQRDWQERMMDKQNQYNSPIADKLRKMAAGVNPYAGELNSVPSASAGTGASAQTIPMGDPLASAFTMAQIRKLDAETGKTVTETDKILAEISNLELLHTKGIITNDELEFRLGKLKQAWEQKSQYEADLEQTEANTENLNQQTAESNERTSKAEAERLFTEALTATENALRDARVQTEKARAVAENASASANLAQANKLIQEGKLVSNEVDRDTFKRSAETFYGFNFDGIDPELVASFMSYYSDVYSGKMDATTALNNAKNDLQHYIDRDLFVPKSNSSNNTMSIAWGLVSAGRARSKSGETPTRTPYGASTRW